MHAQKVVQAMICKTCETAVLPDEFPYELQDDNYTWECPNCFESCKGTLNPSLTYSEAEAKAYDAFSQAEDDLIHVLNVIRELRDKAPSKRIKRHMNRSVRSATITYCGEAIG